MLRNSSSSRPQWGWILALRSPERLAWPIRRVAAPRRAIAARGTFLHPVSFSLHRLFRRSHAMEKHMMALLWIWIIAAPAAALYLDSRRPLSASRTTPL